MTLKDANGLFIFIFAVVTFILLLVGKGAVLLCDKIVKKIKTKNC